MEIPGSAANTHIGQPAPPKDIEEDGLRVFLLNVRCLSLIIWVVGQIP
jgi:hypothetical protein